MPNLERYIAATVRWRRDYGPELWSVRLELEAPFQFRPGQYATLAVEDEEGLHERPYSIVSSPREAGLEFFFELVPEGELTPRLHRLGEGDRLWVRRAAKGLFQLDSRSGRARHLMVATVTGVAPFVSMLRTLAAPAGGEPGGGGTAPETLALIVAASRSWEFGYREEVLALAERLPALRPVFSVSRPWEDTAWTGECGRAEDILRKYADAAGCQAAATTAYLCGHPQMIANAKGILTRGGFAPRSIHEELYWIPPKAAAKPAASRE
jgi:ferredoxin--NADP+ reductase